MNNLSDIKRGSATLWIGTGLLAVLLFAGVAGPLLMTSDPNEMQFTRVLQSPSARHIMGTDEFGRDLFSRSLHALRLDLWVIAIITVLPMIMGMLLGTVAGFFGGAVDRIVTRFIDFFVAFPLMILVIAVVAIVGPGLRGVFVAVLSVGWVMYAQINRAEMMVLRTQHYILAAHALGYSRRRILLRHAIPNLWRPNIVFASSDAVLNLLLLSGLSYLGLGAQAPQAELGSLVASGQQYLLQAWWISTLPGVVVLALGISLSMFGDGLSDKIMD